MTPVEALKQVLRSHPIEVVRQAVAEVEKEDGVSLRSLSFLVETTIHDVHLLGARPGWDNWETGSEDVITNLSKALDILPYQARNLLYVATHERAVSLREYDHNELAEAQAFVQQLWDLGVRAEIRTRR